MNWTIGALNTTSTFQGNIATDSKLTKVGSGSLILTASSAFIGQTTISNGTLQLGNRTIGNDGTLANTSGITNNGTLIYNRYGSISSDRVISGSGAGTKDGSGTQILTGANSHTGATTVSAGTLKVSGSVGNSNVTVSNAGTILASGTTGTIGNNVTVNSDAILAAGGNQAFGTATALGATTLNSGSIFSWDINDAAAQVAGMSYDNVLTTGLSGSGAIFNVLLNGGQTFSDVFWTTSHLWDNLFSTDVTSNGALGLASIFSSFNYANGSNPLATPDAGSIGSFTITGSTLSRSAVPEPTSALAGVLLGAGLLRRRRSKVAGV